MASNPCPGARQRAWITLTQSTTGCTLSSSRGTQITPEEQGADRYTRQKGNRPTDHQLAPRHRPECAKGIRHGAPLNGEAQYGDGTGKDPTGHGESVVICQSGQG